MGFWSLFVTALMPILKVLVVTGIGLFIALERIDLLGPTARHHLNTAYQAIVEENIYILAQICVVKG
ncbi:unnamed protein product, partial [Vitis vinifera]